MSYAYRMFPGGNINDYPGLDKELIRRGVLAEYIDLVWDGRIYLIPLTEVSKLPTDEKGYYLGNDECGFSMFEIKNREDLLKTFDAISEWKKLGDS